MVIIVFGLPGSGKSYFAGRLAKSLDAIYVSSDIERKKLISQRKYTFSEKMMVYDRMFELMEIAIKDGKSIVLDASFYRNSIRNCFIQKATELGQTALFIEVTAKTETIKKRLSKKREHSDADYSIYLSLKKSFEPLRQNHLALSSDDDIEDMLESGLNYINKKNE
jgi:predicted kinase